MREFKLFNIGDLFIQMANMDKNVIFYSLHPQDQDSKTFMELLSKNPGLDKQFIKVCVYPNIKNIPIPEIIRKINTVPVLIASGFEKPIIGKDAVSWIQNNPFNSDNANGLDYADIGNGKFSSTCASLQDDGAGNSTLSQFYQIDNYNSGFAPADNRTQTGNNFAGLDNNNRIDTYSDTGAKKAQPDLMKQKMEQLQQMRNMDFNSDNNQQSNTGFSGFGNQGQQQGLLYNPNPFGSPMQQQQQQQQPQMPIGFPMPPHQMQMQMPPQMQMQQQMPQMPPQMQMQQMPQQMQQLTPQMRQLTPQMQQLPNGFPAFNPMQGLQQGPQGQKGGFPNAGFMNNGDFNMPLVPPGLLQQTNQQYNRQYPQQEQQVSSHQQQQMRVQRQQQNQQLSQQQQWQQQQQQQQQQHMMQQQQQQQQQPQWGGRGNNREPDYVRQFESSGMFPNQGRI